MHISKSARRQLESMGFTLIEVMIVVAIISILSAIALPIYRNYVISGDITEATTNLSGMRAKMEQYYQDNRTYSTVSSSILSPCDSTSLATLNAGLKYFQISCPISGNTYNWATSGATVYTLVATGNSTALTTGFVYTLDNYNNQTSTMGPAWGSTSCSSTWKISKSGGC
jgi:type IV pilus assembly protein PilE